MFKIIFCLRRKPGLSREAFLAYWREHHGPLMRRNAAAMGVRGYRQMAVLDDRLARRVADSRHGPEPYDGVAEVWWDSRQAYEAAIFSDAGRAAAKAMYEDEKTFIDLESSPIFLAQPQYAYDAD